MNLFRGLPPDRQADILKNIQAAQCKYGFRFIYPILMGRYDSTRIFTSKEGPYHGMSLYEVMKQLIELDHQIFDVKCAGKPVPGAGEQKPVPAAPAPG